MRAPLSLGDVLVVSSASALPFLLGIAIFKRFHDLYGIPPPVTHIAVVFPFCTNTDITNGATCARDATAIVPIRIVYFGNVFHRAHSCFDLVVFYDSKGETENILPVATGPALPLRPCKLPQFIKPLTPLFGVLLSR